MKSVRASRRVGVVVAAAMAIGMLVVAGYLAVTRDRSEAVTLWGYDLKVGERSDRIDYLDYLSDSEKLEVVRMRGVDPPVAERLIDEKIFMFGSLFEKQRVGYQGQHTEYIECLPPYKPIYGEKVLSGGYIRYFRGFATDRYGYGACDSASARFLAVNAYVYCERDHTVYDVNYFSASGDGAVVERFVGGIMCADE
jgi:hypothetical protein